MPSVGSAAQQSPQKWALLVGVDDYVRARDLKFCAADQQALAKQLIASGFPQDQVFLLHDKAERQQFRPFKSNIEEQLRLVMSLVEPGDTIIVGFSCHGVHVEGKSYLCPADAKFDDAASTMVPLDKVYHQLAACQATLKLLMVDACRNDPRLGGERSLNPQESIRGFGQSLERPPEGITLLASCSPGQTAREDDELGHGVFMHFVLEGLKGKAADDDGLVSLMRLADYTSRETKKYVARRFVDYQTPYFRGELAGPVELVKIDPRDLLPQTSAVPQAPKPTVPIDPALNFKITQYSEKIRINPRDDHAWNERGRVWDDLGEYDKAIADYTEALRIAPNDAVLWNNLALARNNNSDYRTALANYAEALRLNPKFVSAYTNRAITWREMGNHEYALKDLNYAIHLDPKFANAYNQRGVTWADKKEYDKAIADHNQAIRLKPSASMYYYNRGTTWQQKGEYDKALADFDYYVRMNPRDANGYNLRGIVWDNKGEHDKAIAEYDQAIRQNPSNKFFYYNRGDAWSEKKNFDQAIADFSEAIRLDPSYAWAHNYRGYCLVEKGEYDQAIPDFSEAIRLDSSFAIAYSNRGWAFYEKGDLDQAVIECGAAIRLDPNDAGAFRVRGCAWEDTGEHEKALADFDVAIKLDPKNKYTYSSRAWAHNLHGDHGLALADANEAINLDAVFAYAYRHRGDALAGLGKYEEALAAYRDAVKLDPTYERAYARLAMLHATCPEDKFLDPDLALELAKKAMDLNAKKFEGPYLALAAAYARLDDFKAAIEWQTKALEFCSNETERAKGRKQLAVYKSGQPWREPAVASETQVSKSE
jgi:tetratricopeptide (TPR) repeat protein